LARFDGYEFRNFSAADGIAPAPIRSMLETRAGVYWIGTSRGLVRFDAAGEGRRGPGAPARILPLPGGGTHDDILALLEGRTGALWIGTEDGLFRLAAGARDARFEAVEFPASETSGPVNALLEDPDGTLWVGAEIGLFSRRPGGTFTRITDAHGR